MRLSFLVYDVIIRVYAAGIRIAAIFNPKARLWLNGRRGWQAKLRKAVPAEGVGLWMHCASLGEFEQGRPVLEAYRESYPGHFILLSFFSPSGFEVRKNYPGADYVCYLPLDTAANAQHFIQITAPKLAIFVKYEFWLHYLSELHRQGIPLILISAIFRKEQLFFQWYGKSFKRLLTYYNQIFVQDQASAELLRNEGLSHVALSGDTRFDRVAQIARQAKDIDGIADFLQGKEAWVAGSTWPQDEDILSAEISQIPKWIIAPHEIHEDHLRQIEKRFIGKTVRYSQLKHTVTQYTDKQILLIDNIGMLSSLYRYGTVAYIGGGFGKGIHNVLEAAIWNMPVIFGPAFQKFKEARDLIERQAAFSISDTASFSKIIDRLQDPATRREAGTIAGNYVREQTGATAKIMDYIRQP